MITVIGGLETHFFFMHSEKALEEIAFSILEETDYKIIELVVRGEKAYESSGIVC